MAYPTLVHPGIPGKYGCIYVVVVIIRGVVDFIRQMVEDRQDAAALKKWKIERQQQRTRGPHNGD